MMSDKEIEEAKEAMKKAIAEKVNDPAFNWQVFYVKDNNSDDSPAQKLLEELIRKKFLGDEKA